MYNYTYNSIYIMKQREPYWEPRNLDRFTRNPHESGPDRATCSSYHHHHHHTRPLSVSKPLQTKTGRFPLVKGSGMVNLRLALAIAELARSQTMLRQIEAPIKI